LGYAQFLLMIVHLGISRHLVVLLAQPLVHGLGELAAAWVAQPQENLPARVFPFVVSRERSQAGRQAALQERLPESNGALQLELRSMLWCSRRSTG
jgi:hypothetical protein